MPFQIRRAVESDSQGVYEAHARAIRETCASRYTEVEIEAWAGRLYPGAHLDAIRTRQFYVAEEDGLILGFGQLNAATGEVEAVYVLPKASRRGVGSKLLERLEECAYRSGIDSLYLDASLNSIQFYEASGFHQDERTSHVLTSGVAIACVRMSKSMTSGRGVHISRGESA